MRIFGSIVRNGSAIMWLTSINILMFVAVRLADINADLLGMHSSSALLIQHPWVPLTYMFVHYNIWHLLANVMWLWMFGSILQQTSSGGTVRLMYVVGGVFGALFYWVGAFILPSSGLLCGASASVLAVMIATGLSAPDMSVSLLLLGRVKIKWLVLTGVVLIFIGAGTGGFSAHIGGLSGGVVATLWLRQRPMYALRNRIDKMRRDFQNRKKGKRMTRALAAYRKDMARLDSLLDRVRVSGFDSLTANERRELQNLSATLSAKIDKTKVE